MYDIVLTMVELCMQLEDFRHEVRRHRGRIFVQVWLTGSLLIYVKVDRSDLLMQLDELESDGEEIGYYVDGTDIYLDVYSKMRF